MKILDNTMTAIEESELILTDLFGDDVQARSDAINDLCEQFGIDENSEELPELIVSEEDALYERYYPRDVEAQ